jgi:hypothetical protein
MKKLFILILTCYASIGNAQIRNYTIEYDLCDKDNIVFVGPENCNQKRLVVKNGSFVSFIVKNVNPLKYEIEIDDETLSFNTEASPIFKPVVGDKGTKPVDSAIFKLNEPDARAKLDFIFNYANKLDIFIKNYQSEKCFDMDKFKNEVSDNLQDGVSYLGLNTSQELTDTALLVSKIQSMFASLKPNEKKVLQDRYDTRKSIALAVKEEVEIILKAYNSQTEASSLKKQMEYNADAITFNLKVKDLTTKTTRETGPYYVWNKCGLKIDFSTGFVFSGLVNNEYSLKDTSYIDKTSKDTISNYKKIFKNDVGKFNPGIAAYMHVYPRTGTAVNVGLTLGLAYTGDNVTQWLAGICILLGREQRFVLSGGIAAGKIKTLPATLKIGGIYKGETSEVPTIEKNQVCYFLGISYNITGIKTAKQASKE